MKKPSFFQKLTGASWSDDDSKEPSKVTKIKKDKEKPKMKSMKTESSKEKTTVVSAKKSEPTAKKNVKEKDWLNESEGQLTIDVYQTASEVIIKSTIAGVTKGEIDISMNNDMITIKGNRQKDEQVKEEDYYYQECYWGPFSRSIILPVDVEVDQAEASLKNGILTIKLPKIEKVKTKKIEITTD